MEARELYIKIKTMMKERREIVLFINNRAVYDIQFVPKLAEDGEEVYEAHFWAGWSYVKADFDTLTLFEDTDNPDDSDIKMFNKGQYIGSLEPMEVRKIEEYLQ